ncbi:nucleoid-associated protein [Pseudomonas sp. P5_152]|uniref:nucleoid-associated protein n=1 Tax=Pseudomonas sp. P5_152 TaxID=3043442 RepID=UPI002A365EE3|nr:nucleoid-associated protein [Pseudomonas sp. P5_152]MDX9667976.1 nucleoid-associated protein [Pseudomonas sp. P5_152]
MEESNLSIGRNALFCHYQKAVTDYLVIALMQETEAVIMTNGLTLMPIRHLDLDHIHLTVRINLREWEEQSQVASVHLAYPKQERVQG